MSSRERKTGSPVNKKRVTAAFALMARVDGERDIPFLGHVRLPFNLIWKRDDSSPLLQKFVAQVEAAKDSAAQ
jgi:hypothetical protein